MNKSEKRWDIGKEGTKVILDSNDLYGPSTPRPSHEIQSVMRGNIQTGGVFFPAGFTTFT
jgi:hypothetical protein